MCFGYILLPMSKYDTSASSIQPDFAGVRHFVQYFSLFRGLLGCVETQAETAREEVARELRERARRYCFRWWF